MGTTFTLTPDLGDATQTQQWLEEAHVTGTTDTYSRKYRDPRTTWNVPLEIHICPDGHRAETIYATSFDISEGGVGFRSRKPIPPFTSVVICRAGEMTGAPAVTLSSTPCLQGHLIGAEFRFETEAAMQQRVNKAG